MHELIKEIRAKCFETLKLTDELIKSVQMCEHEEDCDKWCEEIKKRIDEGEDGDNIAGVDTAE